MSITIIPEPLHLAKLFGVQMRMVALKLRVTPDWLRQLARKPHYARRVRVAELEAILEQERLALIAEGLIAQPRPFAVKQVTSMLEGEDDAP